LQIWWLVVVRHGLDLGLSILIPFSMLIAFLNFQFKDHYIDPLKYIMIIFCFILWGIIQDSLLVQFGGISDSSFVFYMTPLWVALICYLDGLPRKGIAKTKFLIGSAFFSIGAVFVYKVGLQISSFNIDQGKELSFNLIVLVSWFLFPIFSYYLYFQKTLLDKLLDISVFFSFDRSGYLRHRRFFREEMFSDISNSNILITGGTSGIGKALALDLKSYGATVYVTGRNLDKGSKCLREGLVFVPLDMSNWDEVTYFSRSEIKFDHIVLNAGGMPSELKLNDSGYEAQLSSQLLGHYLLCKCLKTNDSINVGAKIIWVSSGGMYLKKLSVKELLSTSKYDKVDTYANVKRAQVILSERMGNDDFWRQFSVFSMHPGWVASDGLKSALPKFFNFTENRLRTPLEGGDTISWLIRTRNSFPSGSFFFDRKIVSPYISKKYLPPEKEVDELTALINSALDKYDL
jgi:dehydrogenase/reductase SDR family protein 12